MIMQKKRTTITVSIIFLLSLAGAALWLSSPSATSGEGVITGKDGCLSCHSGIEDISPKMTRHFYSALQKKPGFECSVCHSGNPDAKDKDNAHKGMYANPSDLSVADKVCGQCHEDHVDRVEKSLMANAQGEIAGTLYARGYAKDRSAAFAMSAHPIVDKDGVAPKEKGAVERLDPIPDSSEHISVEMLRKFCVKCHLRTDGTKAPKAYRSSGCAACHMPTAADGKYAGSDMTMKGKEWRASTHRITSKVPSEQCARCHKGGNRIGVSYISELPGHESDIHYQKGMHCIDCHSSKEIHGDGNIYLRKWQAVKIRCASCHGDHLSKPTLSDSEGDKLKNIRQDGDRYILTSKITGKEHTIPALDTLKAKDKLPTAMLIPQHLAKMECAACHSTKNANCYACHFKVDRTKMGKDTITEKESEGQWSIIGGDFALKWKNPPLSLHQSGKAAPNQLGCAVHITEIGKDGKNTKEYAVNHESGGNTKDGFTAFGRVSVGNAHTTQRSGIRSCDECHNDPSALGLGSKTPETFKSGKKLMADPDRFVDEKGKQLLAFTQIGQRPFNSEELNRIRRVGECTICHAGAKFDFWIDFEKRYRWTTTNAPEHKKKIELKMK
jgi:hypothetical protein